MSPQQVNEGGTASVNVTTTDSNPVVFSATGLPTGLGITSSGPDAATITGTVAPPAAGVYSVKVSATDTITNATGTVEIVNPAPQLSNPGTQTNSAGAAVSLAITAANTNPVTFSATGLPSGLGIDPTTGLITGTVGPNAVGSSLVTVTAADSVTKTTASVSFIWVIAPANGTPSPTPTPTPTSTTGPGSANTPSGGTQNVASLLDQVNVEMAQLSTAIDLLLADVSAGLTSPTGQANLSTVISVILSDYASLFQAYAALLEAETAGTTSFLL